MDLEERLAKIEKEIRETPYHKATEHHIGQLRAKLAKLKNRLDQQTQSKGGNLGFAVKKTGDATVVLVGPPSVGKSTLINQITHAESKVGAYDFTTLEVIPGMLLYKGAQIQVLDVPGLIGGAAKGKGRGKEVLSVIRHADLIILMTDLAKIDSLPQIQKELEQAGAEAMPIITVVNKAEGIDKVTKQKLVKKGLIPISAQKGLGLEKLKEAIWQNLNLIRVYLKPKGKKADKQKPLILKKGATILEAAQAISSELEEDLESARIWGPSAKFPGQEVSLSHRLADEDILLLLKK